MCGSGAYSLFSSRSHTNPPAPQKSIHYFAVNFLIFCEAIRQVLPKPFFSDIVHAHGMLHCLLNPLAAAGMDGEVRYYLCVDEHVPGVHFAAANVAPQEKPRAESSGDMRVSFITLQLSLKFSMGQFPLQKMGWCPPHPPATPGESLVGPGYLTIPGSHRVL